MFTRECESCGSKFETDNLRRKTCKKNCGRSSATKHRVRTTNRKNNEIHFVGVDGEGVDRPDGRHEYVMLSVGDQTLWDGGRQLQLESILAFLWKQYQQKPEAAFVGFFLGYDFIQWLKLLAEREARLLFTPAGIAERKSAVVRKANPYPDAVVWNGWEIDIMAGRRFKLRPHVCHSSEWNPLCRNRTCRRDTQAGWSVDLGPRYLVEGEADWRIPEDDSGSELYSGDPVKFWEFHTRLMHEVGDKSKGKAFGWMYVCDTGSFWQTSFLNVIDPKGWGDEPVCSDSEYELVLEGKNSRSKTHEVGDVSYYEDMVKYNVLENEILGRVTGRLNKGFMNERIPIKIPKTDWYGPGRAAQLWIDQLHERVCEREAREHNKGKARFERVNERGLLNADIYMSLPTWFYEAAQSSYYGGWFEQFMHGHVGDVYEYDINSAYPHIISSLPCLHTEGDHDGSYVRGTGGEIPREGYTLVYGTFEGSDPYVGAMPYRNKAGLISRPQRVKGWYWWHEVAAAQRCGVVERMEVEKWVSYSPCSCTPPFDPADIGIRSLYQLRLDAGKNSPRGKAAKLVYNSAYGKTAQSIGEPKYSNPIYASLITAGCRTLILEAIATHPLGTSGVTMVATDGVYFVEQHPSLHLDKQKLGAWDESHKKSLTQLMPGVYWDEETREAVKGGGSPKLKSRGVAGRDLAREIARLDDLFAEAHLRLASGGEYDWPTIELRTGFLLDSCKSALARGKWGTAGRVTHGAVRSISGSPVTKRIAEPYLCPEFGVVRTRPYQEGERLETTPYQKSFGYLEHVEGMNNVFGDRVSKDGDDGMQYWRDLINGTGLE